MFDYLVYFLAALNFLAAIIGIADGLRNAIYGLKYRGWMSPFAQFVRETLSLAATILVFWNYWNGMFSGMVASLLLVGASTFCTLFVIWGDYKYRKANGLSIL